MNVQVGMYVAARWKDEMWYRARVVKFKTLATVSLFYIDYVTQILDLYLPFIID